MGVPDTTYSYDSHLDLQLIWADKAKHTFFEADEDFYHHEVGWANRLILSDSLLVMNSLLVKEGMAGKLQMIYMDPPCGMKYSSNFQPRIDRRDVKDKDEELIRGAGTDQGIS